MISRADAAPNHTVKRECVIASMAAMRNVLSPISDSPISRNAALNASEDLAKVDDEVVT